MGCYLQPVVIQTQGDSLAVIGFAQSAAVYTLHLKEKKSKQKLDLLKKARQEKKPVCIYLKKNTPGAGSIIADVKWTATDK